MKLHHIILSVSTLTIGLLNAQNKRNSKKIEFPMNEKNWIAVTDNVEFLTYKSVQAVKSDNNDEMVILLRDFEFTDGTIEFDVEFKERSFPAIDFHADNNMLNSEKFYIRYFGTPQGLKRNTLQYTAVVDSVNLWDLTDDYQAAATIHEGKWNHVKLVVSGRQMKVYVNDMERAALHVPALEGITKSGSIVLTGNVVYANFVVRPNTTEDLSSKKGYDPTYNDPRYLRNWSVSEPADFPFGKDIMMEIPSFPRFAIDTLLLHSSTIWKPIKAERRALINLTKMFGATEQGQRRLTWLKTTISSETAQEKRVDLGFSDEVWVFINGEILLIDKNYYGSPGMKEPKGRCTIENTSFKLPLQKGANEVLIGITNYFYGWGIIARLENTEGLNFN